MILEFFLPFDQLNFQSLLLKKQVKVIEKSDLIITEVVKLFEYRKNNDRYWDGVKLHYQVVNKALLIVKAIYLGYLLIFLFDNTTNHLVYVKNVLHIKEINKNSEK